MRQWCALLECAYMLQVWGWTGDKLYGSGPAADYLVSPHPSYLPLGMTLYTYQITMELVVS